MDTYSYGSDYAAVGGILGVLFGVLAVFFVIVLILMILNVIGQWKMFKKANEEGWKALIPIYNTYTLCKIVGVNPWWILIVFVAALFSSVPIIGLVSPAASIYFTVMIVGSTAKSYGKETGWAVGLALLGPIFTFALGVGKSEYQGVKPINDPIMEKINGTKTNTENVNPTTANPVQTPTESVANSTTAAKFCAGCGAKLDENTKFCPSCGRQV